MPDLMVRQAHHEVSEKQEKSNVIAKQSRPAGGAGKGNGGGGGGFRFREGGAAARRDGAAQGRRCRDQRDPGRGRQCGGSLGGTGAAGTDRARVQCATAPAAQGLEETEKDGPDDEEREGSRGALRP